MSQFQGVQNRPFHALRTLWQWALLLLAITCSGLASSVTWADTKPLRVITDDNYPPYLFKNAEGQHEGYLVDYWALWSRKTGTPVELIAVEWAEAQRRLLAGDADVIDMIFQTPMRLQHYDFSEPYAEVPVGIYVDRDIRGIGSVQALKGFQVGVQAGDACSENLRAAGVVSQVIYPNYEALLAAVAAQEVRIVCMDEQPGNFYLYRTNLAGSLNKAFTLRVDLFRRAVKKGNLAALEKVIQGDALITESEKKSLLTKWVGTPLVSDHALKWAGWAVLATVLAGIVLVVWNMLLRAQVRARTAELGATLNTLKDSIGAEQQTRTQLAATLEAVPDLLFEFDEQGVYLDVYTNRASLLYLPKSALVGKSVQELLPPDAASQVMEAIRGTLQSGHDDGRMITLEIEGQPRWFELSAAKKMGESFCTVVMLSRDVSARKSAEQALQEAQAEASSAERNRFFKALFNAAPVAVAYLKADRLVHCNQQFAAFF